ncbi:MAG: 30S ribosomal protein S17 [Candidatus Pacearchaeota archaeon]
MAKEKKETGEAKINRDNNATTECKDLKCPKHGNLSVHGRNFQGTVKKIVGKRVVIEFERLIYYKKYERFAKARTKLHAYLPDCLRKKIIVGDVVKIGECRPLSKIMHFVVMEKLK